MYYNERICKENLWIEKDGSLAAIGITKEFENKIGDIIIFEYMKKNGYVQEGDRIARIETINNEYFLNSPYSGYIMKYNYKLESDPSLINIYPEEIEILIIDTKSLI
ncbi:glycine cleavage system protein H [Caldicellulosiruptoraceae bacterium PP1]